MSVVSGLGIRKAPASDRFGEVGGVFVLTERGFGFDAIDVAAGSGEHGFYVAAIFCIVNNG